MKKDAFERAIEACFVLMFLAMAAGLAAIAAYLWRVVLS